MKVLKPSIGNSLYVNETRYHMTFDDNNNIIDVNPRNKYNPIVHY